MATPIMYRVKKVGFFSSFDWYLMPVHHRVALASQVMHYERECRILLQAENGPCPLLAIANVLLLRGSVSLTGQAISTGMVTVDEVITLIATKLLDTKPPVSISVLRTPVNQAF